MKKMLLIVLGVMVLLGGVFQENTQAQGWYVDLDCGFHSAEGAVFTVDYLGDCDFKLLDDWTITREDWVLVDYGIGYRVHLRLCYISDAPPLNPEIVSNITVVDPLSNLKIGSSIVKAWFLVLL